MSRLTPKQKRMKQLWNMIARLVAYVVGLGVLITLGILFVKYFGMQTVVIDESMSPILQSEDVVLIDSLSFKTRDPKRMDIVSIKIGSARSSPSYVRRIIGIPGDTVRITGGMVYVNDEKVTFPSTEELVDLAGTAEEGITLGEGMYFVMCDDYNNTHDDSRLDSIGMISSDQIKGKVWMIMAPLSRLKKL